jgi:hypothetical protein
MDINQTFEVWKNAVIGASIDIDRSYGAQCADVPLSWATTVFPNVAWATLFKPTTSAKNFLGVANVIYFDLIYNNNADVNQLPQKGDIAVFGAVPKGGKPGYTSKFENPDGHVGVVDHADQKFIYLVQQDGSTGQTRTQLIARPWRYSECLGWLRPRVTAVGSTPQSTGPVNHPLIGKDVWFKPPVKPGWAVYDVGQFPDRAKAKGFMRPDMFNEGPDGAKGFIKRILGVSKYANTVTIQTDTWGIVDVYLDGDAQIL